MSTEEERDLDRSVKQSWGRFVDTYEPLRPDLYRYCRHLTRSPWDAEDMAQEAMARAFVSLACMPEPPRNPRAWLFRVASNLWINRSRQKRELLVTVPEPTTSSEPRATREAAGTLLSQLSPQERAAVVLKDVFDLPLEEIAGALATSVGAIKTALHRGRAKLGEEPAEPRPVAPAVLDAFCTAFNARDLDRLTGLLLETATMEFPGVLVEYGARTMRDGSLRSTLFGCTAAGHEIAAASRCDVHVHRGEGLLLWWWRDEVHAVVRVETDGEKIARMHDYHHSPDVLEEVCRELGVPFRTHGYRPKDTRARED
jgi:RNA polymerase sigma-70 factor, ECF subfamily